MPRLSLGLGVQTIRKVGGGAPPPSNLPLSTTPIILNFSSEVISGAGFPFSAGNYSLNRFNNSNWRTSGETQLSPGFFYGLSMTYNSSWPGTYGGFATGDNKWVVYRGYDDDGTPYFDSLYYHPTHPSTSIPYSGWLLGSLFGTPTTGGNLTITAA